LAQRAEVRVEVEPPWPFSLPRMHGMDGLTRSPRGVVHRLIHEDGSPVLIRVAQLTGGNVLFGAQAADEDHARRAITRMRRALGVDVDLSEFYRRFRDDPLIGAALRANPTLRTRGRPHAFEALSFAVTEQLIEYERAAAIQRRMIRALGRRDQHTGMRDSPDAVTLAGASPARLESFDLSASRAVALVKVAREVAAGRVDLSHAADTATQEQGWRRLRKIPGIGAWTVEMLAVVGQGRLDQIPAGDLGFIKLVGRLLSGGDPYARASEEQVRQFFARFGEWRALAGVYAYASGGGAGKVPV
jgi:3-methyladenine DNA glycosylase/8-oxoguanine DNA glycosylase